MLAALEDLRGEFTFKVKVVDIDSYPKLACQYNQLVPLIEANGMQLCYYLLDVEAARSYLRTQQNHQ